MTKRATLSLLLVGLVAAALWSLPTVAERFQDVRVVNLPEIQQIDGSVAVPEPVPHARMHRFKSVAVSPAPRAEPDEWSTEGDLETAGFTYAVLTLTGDVRGRLGEPATVGAVLVPDEPRPRDILRENDVAVLSLEVTAQVEPGRSYFTSEVVRLPLSFPAYRVYLWNGSSNAVTADLSVYLTH